MAKPKNLIGLKKIFFIFLLAFFIFHGPQVFASTLVDTDITQDTTWTQAGSPFIVMASIKVFANVTLTIEPGVVVKFNPIFSYSNNSIFVLGKLIANGTTENKIYFTSNYDDELGGNTDDEEFCYDDIDADRNIVGEICESYDLGDPFVEDWDGIYFKDSTDSILQNVSIRYARDAFNIESSSVDFNNLNINDTTTGVTIFDNSHIKISNSVLENINKDVFVIFNDSSLLGDNLKIANIFNDRTDVIALFNHSSLSLKNSSFKDCPNEACVTFFDGNNYISKPSSVNIEDTIFDGGLGSGLLTFGGSEITTSIKNSVFKNFGLYAIENYSDFTVNAKNNFWGDASGPYHATLNPGGLGTPIFGNILFDPWLASDPFEVCTVNCFSNVLFFPGLMGSKLYEKGLDCGGDLTGDECGDKLLWISTNDSLQEKLSLNTEGKSVNDIFTKNDTQKLDEDDEEMGIIDEIFGLNTYKSFLTDLKNWKQNGTIKDYAFIPYDWRFSLEDIITNGTVDADNNLSYDTAQNFSESFILKKLEALQKSSKSGKVTIIAHSNGGLVTKALVQKLKDTNNPLYDKIDKIIFVAVPQVGTPSAFINLLHGADLGPGGLIMSNERSRQLAENMSSVYGLLPSASYFTMSQVPFAPDKLITFENKQFFNSQISKYGLNISDETELKDYILGGDDRVKPTFDDTTHPNIGNSVLYNQAQNVHQILDNWQPSLNTKVIQVAGWGEETLSRIDYKSYVDFWGSEYLSYKPFHVVDGDGTVVVPSALWMSTISPNVERWWVDLPSYDTLTNFERIHKDILEITNLRNFIKSKIEDSDFTDPDNILVNNTSTLISSGSRLHYTLHSPLTLGVIDSEGRYTGQDPVTKKIREEIPGINYKKIGDVQFISAPAELAYTVKMQGYQNGSFALDVEKQEGNNVSSFASFQGIPSSVSTIATMDVVSNMEIADSELKIDQNGDGIIDKILEATPDDITIYDITPPELQMTFDAFTKDVVFSAQDLIDKNPTIATTKNSVTLRDNSDNTTIILFTKTRERPNIMKFSYEKIGRNGINIRIPNNNVLYDWRQNMGILTDLNTKITIKGVEKYVFRYNKVNDVTIIEEKTNNGIITTTRVGFVNVSIKTGGDSLLVNY